MITYESADLTLGSDFLEDAFGRINLNDLPERAVTNPFRLTGSTPILERLWSCALYDVESNILELRGKPYFCAGGRGKGFNQMVFTRDFAYASLLGVGNYYPDIMRSCMEMSRELRLEMGLLVPEDHDIGWVFADHVEHIDHGEFMRKYGTNPYCRRTDDVVWLWWAEELFKDNFNTLSDWQWIYDTGKRCFDELYTPFFDESDGLYWGQATFIDIGFNGYPPIPGVEYNTVEAYRKSLQIKASSTNALYYHGMMVMSRCAERLGLQAEADAWSLKAKELRQSYRKNFIRPDGSIIYYIHADGMPEPRREALGTALAVLLGLLDNSEGAAAFKDYPEYWWGIPLFTPFYDTEASYHNHSSWPFVNSFYLRAKAQATGCDTLPQELALLVRSCHGDTFHEWIRSHDHKPSGKEAQLWTLGAFLGAAAKTGTVIS